MFIYVIQYTCWLYFILVFCSIYPLRMRHSNNASLLHLYLYCFSVDYSISMVTEIYLCTSCYLLLGCTKSWESWRAYLHYIICYAIFPSWLTYIQNSELTYICLNYLSHALKHIDPFLIYQYLMHVFLL